MGMGTDYVTPAGFGDTFFVYAFDGDALTDGKDAYNQRINILDGDFVVRQWAGLATIADKIVIRNRIQSPLMAAPVKYSAFHTAVPLIPEERYPSDGYIGFDLINVARTSLGTVSGTTILGSQLAFTGVRRRLGVANDPMESTYEYYEKPYSYRFDLSITGLGGTPPLFFSQPITDGYDFVLQRIRCVQTPTAGTEFSAPTFKILLYNGNKEQVSNIPVLSTNLLNFPAQIHGGFNNPTNYLPTPSIMYRANSAIQFYITSLLVDPTIAPVAYDLEFSGIRRYPCSGQGR